MYSDINSCGVSEFFELFWQYWDSWKTGKDNGDHNNMCLGTIVTLHNLFIRPNGCIMLYHGSSTRPGGRVSVHPRFLVRLTSYIYEGISMKLPYTSQSRVISPWLSKICPNFLVRLTPTFTISMSNLLRAYMLRLGVLMFHSCFASLKFFKPVEVHHNPL